MSVIAYHQLSALILCVEALADVIVGVVKKPELMPAIKNRVGLKNEDVNHA